MTVEMKGLGTLITIAKYARKE